MTAKRSKRTTPAGLSDFAANWWQSVRDEFLIDDPAGAALLEAAAFSLDRARQARAAIDEEGVSIRDRWGQVKPHPLLPAERDALSSFRAALRDLHLDVQPPQSIGKGRT